MRGGGPRRGETGVAAGVLVAWAVLLLLAPTAAAHAEAVGTEPAFLGGLPQAPPTVRIHFSEPVVAAQSYVAIYDEQLLRRDTGNVSVDPKDPTVLIVPTGHLTMGIYTLGYQTVSAQDGHTERSSLTMSIGVPCDTCLAPPHRSGWTAWNAASSVTKGMAYLAVAFALGQALLRLLLGWTWAPRWGRAVLLAGAAAQALAASWTPDPLWPVAAAVLLAIAAAASRTWRVVAVAGLAALAAVVATGHAQGWDQGLAFLHGATLLAWAGSLAGLWAWLRSDPADLAAVRHYSRVASGIVVVLVVSGIALSLERLQGWPDLASAYGQVWAAKVGAALVVLALGATTHRRLWAGWFGPASPLPPAAALRRAVGGEAWAGLGVILLTGLLVGLPTPVAAHVASRVEAQWDGDTHVELTITPASASGNLTPGDHVQRVRLTDLDGNAIRGAHVRLLVHHTILDLPSLVVQMPPEGDSYAASGTYLGALGDWDVEVLYFLPGTPIGDLSLDHDGQLPGEHRVRFRLAVGTVTHLHGGIRISDPHFDTGYLDPGDAATIHFGTDRLGTFALHCHPHPWMQMTLHVVANQSAAPAPVTVRILGDAGDAQAAMRFDPPELWIGAGSDVRFVNVGDEPHTATNVRWTAPVNGTA